jgi:hypothetical protein
VLLLLGLVFFSQQMEMRGSKLNGKGSRRAGAGCCFPDQKLIEMKECSNTVGICHKERERVGNAPGEGGTQRDLEQK